MMSECFSYFLLSPYVVFSAEKLLLILNNYQVIKWGVYLENSGCAFQLFHSSWFEDSKRQEFSRASGKGGLKDYRKLESVLRCLMEVLASW